ncbi:hypothetical protein JCGZ_11918 [Jatropha curcas]|uniref:Exocyst subunit Exo70 family protein n=2 Tax=Jatropha curcas TaxID=180498 RepID=A0A067KEA3_JATCU|nr:hypothetical protein JCGZ_11918 [Jatropha curcas]
MNQRLPQSLGIATRPNIGIKEQIDCAISPAMAVLKICNAIEELEKAILSDRPCSNLYAYLLVVKQLEQALKFLAANCGLAIQWLEGILQFLEDNDLYASKVNMCLGILQKLQVTDEKARHNGGILSAAFDKLEIEFKRLLAENSMPLSIAAMEKLQAIISRLNANKRLNKCISAYVEVRSMKARRRLEALELNYLENPLSELDDVQDIEGLIDQWCKHLELAVKNVYEAEYKLCNEVFRSDTDRKSCFAEIATKSGLVSFLEFGTRITECKKDPVKLVKLLDIFSFLDNLRTDFNRLFSSEECFEIQHLTRNLIRKVVYGACEIFWELPSQVKLQRQTISPSDGSVPKLASFVTDYCNHLLSDNYKPLLIKVLTIHQSWKNETYQETLIMNQIHCIIKEIGLHLDTLSKGYEDMALSYLFMMNNHCHFSNLKGTKVGDLMGESWVRGHEQYKDYYMTLHLKDTWGKILALLSQGQEDDYTSNDSLTVKKSLKEFNEALDGMYEKQCNWVVPNDKLRLKMCRVAVEAFVPVYRCYLQNYSHLAQEDVKYTAQGLDSMLSSLFQPKIRMCSSNKQREWIHQVKHVENTAYNFHQLTLMAV